MTTRIFAPQTDLLSDISHDPVFIQAKELEKANIQRLRDDMDATKAQFNTLIADTVRAAVTPYASAERLADPALNSVSLRVCRITEGVNYELRFYVAKLQRDLPDTLNGDAHSNYSRNGSGFSAVVKVILQPDATVRFYGAAFMVETPGDDDENDDIFDQDATPLFDVDSPDNAREIAEMATLVSRFIETLLDTADSPLKDNAAALIALSVTRSKLDSKWYDYRSVYGMTLLIAWRRQFRQISADDLQALWDGDAGAVLKIAQISSNQDDTREPGVRVVVNAHYYEISLHGIGSDRRLVDLKKQGYSSWMDRKLVALTKLLADKNTSAIQTNARMLSALLLDGPVDKSYFKSSTIIPTLA